MKNLFAFALLGLSAIAVTAQAEDVTQPAVERYSYSSHLDVAKVISMSSVPDVCDVVPMHMTYEDHQGQRHVLEYRVMGNGCSHG